MRKNIFLSIVLFLLIPCTLSFASSRQEVIDDTLSKVEFTLASGEIPQDNPQNKPEQKEPLEEKPDPERYMSGDEPEVPFDTRSKTRGTFYASAGYDTNHMRYREHQGSDILDEDYGSTSGYYLAIGYKSNNYYDWLFGKPYTEVYYRRHDDVIRYKGRIIGGGDFNFNEKAEIHRMGIKIGARKDVLEKVEVLGYLDLGKRIWYRGENELIEGVKTYAEKYWWPYWGLGAGVNYKMYPQFSVGIEAEGMGAFDNKAKMRADLEEGGTFNLSGVSGVEVKMPLKYYFLKNFSFDVTPYFTYWKIDHSDVTIISGMEMFEPDSYTHIEGVHLGLTYSF